MLLVHPTITMVEINNYASIINDVISRSCGEK